VFDFDHAELVLPSSIITVKPITIKEDYFKFSIPSKTKLKDFINDPIIVSFTSFSIDCPRHNSIISSCRKRTKSFEFSEMKLKTIDVMAIIASNFYQSIS
jgi:hypothetical protein